LEELPKKILIIRDCSFILPDDFNGNTDDAFREFLKYQSEHSKEARYTADSFGLFSTFNMLLHSTSEARVCGEYALLEYRDGQYQISNGPESDH
jgi:hypothetical protein